MLADFLPSSEQFKLDPAIYEMVLYDFLQSDAEGITFQIYFNNRIF